MKLVIVSERGCYAVYEVAEDGGRARIVSFPTEQEARTYCENRKKSRVIAEYEMTCSYG